MDGQYDSRGYSAEMCCVLAMDEAMKRIITFAVIERSEVDGVSQRMEKLGAQRVVEELQGLDLEIGRITIDKHASVMKYFKDISRIFCQNVIFGDPLVSPQMPDKRVTQGKTEIFFFGRALNLFSIAGNICIEQLCQKKF